jgi:hypothetical protein
MTPLAGSYEAWYAGLKAAHRRGLIRHWPRVLAAYVVAVGVAIVVGVLSPDRSQPHAPSPPAPAEAAR